MTYQSVNINDKGEMLFPVTIFEKASEDSHTSETWMVQATPYKESFKYELVPMEILDGYRYPRVQTSEFNEKWAVMGMSWRPPDDLDFTDQGLIYAKVGEWKWTSLFYDDHYPDFIKDLTISDDIIMFYHNETDIAYVCDLSKDPQSFDDCKSLGEVRTPIFDKDNPDITAYMSSYSKVTVADTTKEPWEVIKEFDIMASEPDSFRIELMEKRSNLIVYNEVYKLPTASYQTDTKTCFFRIDKKKNYCMKLNPESDKFVHGKAELYENYLFWESKSSHQFVLRDMDCYCEEEGVCPFED